MQRRQFVRIGAESATAAENPDRVGPECSLGAPRTIYVWTGAEIGGSVSKRVQHGKRTVPAAGKEIPMPQLIPSPMGGSDSSSRLPVVRAGVLQPLLPTIVKPVPAIRGPVHRDESVRLHRHQRSHLRPVRVWTGSVTRVSACRPTAQGVESYDDLQHAAERWVRGRVRGGPLRHRRARGHMRPGRCRAHQLLLGTGMPRSERDVLHRSTAG